MILPRSFDDIHVPAPPLSMKTISPPIKVQAPISPPAFATPIMEPITLLLALAISLVATVASPSMLVVSQPFAWRKTKGKGCDELERSRDKIE
jgi:hypothetical protein